MEGSNDPTNDIVTFIFEGIVLLFVALVGLAGNLALFITIFNQKVQKTFHSLVFLLSIFDMVSRISVKKCKQTLNMQIYLVSAITLFALPSLSDAYARTVQKVTLPIMLPIAHIGMVSDQNIDMKRSINFVFEGWINVLNFGNFG